MTNWTNTREYERLTDKQKIELLRLYGRFGLTIDGYWFLSVEEAHGTDEAIRMDEAAWKGYGKTEGRLLKRFIGLDVVDRLEDICRIYLLTPIMSNLGATAGIEGGKCYLNVTDCHPQKTRIRKGLGEFNCKGVGVNYMEGLLAELNPNIRFRCVVCPPDDHPDDLWCEWEVWIESP